MWSHRAPCRSQHWPGEALHRCTKALPPQIFPNTTEINEITLGLTVPNQADMVKPILCCVQPLAKISESCQLSSEGLVTLHLAEICSLHRTQGMGWEAARWRDHLLQSPAELGWVRPLWAAPQANSSCTALHFLPNTPQTLCSHSLPGNNYCPVQNIHE